ncbi:MAG: hypothetical protein AAGF45_11840 [Pseudomonadota bacterium]
MQRLRRHRRTIQKILYWALAGIVLTIGLTLMGKLAIVVLFRSVDTFMVTATTTEFSYTVDSAQRSTLELTGSAVDTSPTGPDALFIDCVTGRFTPVINATMAFQLEPGAIQRITISAPPGDTGEPSPPVLGALTAHGRTDLPSTIQADDLTITAPQGECGPPAKKPAPAQRLLIDGPIIIGGAQIFERNLDYSAAGPQTPITPSALPLGAEPILRGGTATVFGRAISPEPSGQWGKFLSALGFQPSLFTVFDEPIPLPPGARVRFVRDNKTARAVGYAELAPGMDAFTLRLSAHADYLEIDPLPGSEIREETAGPSPWRDVIRVNPIQRALRDPTLSGPISVLLTALGAVSGVLVSLRVGGLFMTPASKPSRPTNRRRTIDPPAVRRPRRRR